MQRFFIATLPPTDIATIVEERQRTLRCNLSVAAANAIRWTPRTQFHLTLAFLGEVSPEFISEVTTTLEKHCSSLPQQSLQIGKCGFFARRGIPSVLWCDIRTSVELQEWCAALRTDLRLYCPQMDTKDFHPHLTLARVKHGHSIDRAILTDFFDRSALCDGKLLWTCQQISLMKSDICCHGVTHSALSTFSLL